MASVVSELGSIPTNRLWQVFFDVPSLLHAVSNFAFPDDSVQKKKKHLARQVSPLFYIIQD